MPAKYKLLEPGSHPYPDDWVVMKIGEPAPPGVPVGITGWPSSADVKDRLKDLPMLPPGLLHDLMLGRAKRRRAKRRRT